MSHERLNISDLIDQADEVLAEFEAGGDPIDLLSEYAGRFDEWFKRNEKDIRDASPVIDRNQLEQLLSKHERILDITEKIQGQIPEQIRKLKAKGRGILAYTDILPGNISYLKPRKG